MADEAAALPPPSSCCMLQWACEAAPCFCRPSIRMDLAVLTPTRDTIAAIFGSPDAEAVRQEPVDQRRQGRIVRSHNLSTDEHSFRRPRFNNRDPDQQNSGQRGGIQSKSNFHEVSGLHILLLPF